MSQRNVSIHWNTSFLLKFSCYYMTRNSLIPEILEDLVFGPFVGFRAAKTCAIKEGHLSLMTANNQQIYFRGKECFLLANTLIMSSYTHILNKFFYQHCFRFYKPIAQIISPHISSLSLTPLTERLKING